MPRKSNEVDEHSCHMIRESVSFSKELMDVFHEIQAWYMCYAKNNSQDAINRAYPKFREIEKIFWEYARLEGKKSSK